MKHYVLGLIYNSDLNTVLLIKKKRPAWQEGMWNGIGGKIEKGETPIHAIDRETYEETGQAHYEFKHIITFVCPGGTVYVYKAVAFGKIYFKQIEDEVLSLKSLNDLPENMMANLKWIIPVSLSSIQFPLMVQQNELGVK